MFWFFFFLITFHKYLVNANLRCYSCISNEPGCGDDGVNWWIHKAITCYQKDDKCVKIVEKRGADSLIIRDCLSNLITVRFDIPADKFEGCRPAAVQPKLGVNVQTRIKELDIHRNYWTNVTYCFCELDHWCNSSLLKNPSNFVIISLLISAIVIHKMSI